ncbi:hypothetical protein QBC47DRAFT_382281 [Echria macrotheca]|uniref:Secreted protein n=1 Tax=Echria macrotheca TaxID=438768 RepID=A0AAJ0BAZ6_9PEZI|nr:hypothetical protein QBC47DRAFT_382281 [Echria macrotheca]
MCRLTAAFALLAVSERTAQATTSSGLAFSFTLRPKEHILRKRRVRFLQVQLRLLRYLTLLTIRAGCQSRRPD